MKILLFLFAASLFFTSCTQKSPQTMTTNDQKSMLQVRTVNGIVEGTDESGVISFKGIPYAAPPVGDLRWKEPQPVKNWDGVKKTDHFGPRAMQRNIFGDMMFRSDGMSEDCLYLNVWTPAKTSDDRLPVLVYFYGGGLVGGDGSEYRYDGESMARRGIVSLTVNYRLNMFGFFAYPDLVKESPNHTTGNYGYLDQVAALKWVQQNIAAFGGDPSKVTIAGESAGSISVSALMASPLSKNLMAGAIGSSGSCMGALPPLTLEEGEKRGEQFAELAGVKTLDELRKIPADSILAIAKNREFQFLASTVDGYFFPKKPVEIFDAGEQAHIPLMVGWNSAEGSWQAILQGNEPTVQNYKNAINRMYKDQAEDILKLYPASTPEDVKQAATDLASDRFIAQSTWKWCDEQTRTGGQPVFRYFFTHPRPAVRGDTTMNRMSPAGAVHSADIEYAMGNLSTNRVYDWQPADYKVSEIFQDFYVNFIKTGNPNGLGVPAWSPMKVSETSNVMFIDVDAHQVPEPHRDRHEFMDKMNAKE